MPHTMCYNFKNKTLATFQSLNYNPYSFYINKNTEEISDSLRYENLKIFISEVFAWVSVHITCTYTMLYFHTYWQEIHTLNFENNRWSSLGLFSSNPTSMDIVLSIHQTQERAIPIPPSQSTVCYKFLSMGRGDVFSDAERSG